MPGGGFEKPLIERSSSLLGNLFHFLDGIK
jgi:hypothetical protein